MFFFHFYLQYQVLGNFVYPHSILTLQNRKIHQNTPFFNRAVGNFESEGGGVVGVCYKRPTILCSACRQTLRPLIRAWPDVKQKKQDTETDQTQPRNGCVLVILLWKAQKMPNLGFSAFGKKTHSASEPLPSFLLKPFLYSKKLHSRSVKSVSTFKDQIYSICFQYRISVNNIYNRIQNVSKYIQQGMEFQWTDYRPQLPLKMQQLFFSFSYIFSISLNRHW